MSNDRDETVTDEQLRQLRDGLGDDTFAGIVRTVEVRLPEFRSIVTELLARRSPPSEARVTEEMDMPSLEDAHAAAMKAAEIYYDAASNEECMWDGWGDQIVPFRAEQRRIKAKHALDSLRDAESNLALTQPDTAGGVK